MSSPRPTHRATGGRRGAVLSRQAIRSARVGRHAEPRSCVVQGRRRAAWKNCRRPQRIHRARNQQTSAPTWKIMGRRLFRYVQRDEQHELRTRRYIENNPTKAFLVRDPKEWSWSSARFRDENGVLRL